jgi:hypothetical protein
MDAWVEAYRMALVAMIYQSDKTVTLKQAQKLYGLVTGEAISEMRLKELVEFCLSWQYRHLGGESDVVSGFEAISALYQRQPNLSKRSSNSILLQQYSTPAPVAYMAGVYVGLDRAHGSQVFFDPTAGNGMMSIAGSPAHFMANEIDPERLWGLKQMGIHRLTSRDVTKEGFLEGMPLVDGLLVNPPFGTMALGVRYQGYTFEKLEHWVVARSLSLLKAGAKAAIVVGGHTEYGDKGRIKTRADIPFLNYLYNYYHVEGIVNLSGDLYRRMGTSFPVRLILVSGRDSSIGSPNQRYAPLGAKSLVVADFASFYQWITQYIPSSPRKAKPTPPMMNHSLELAKAKLSLKLGLSPEALGMPYQPASMSENKLNIDVPDNMGHETHHALQEIKKAVGTDIDAYVLDRLGYGSITQLNQAFTAEQIDALAMAVYNIEVRSQACIIGDMTGIGKGRIAAGVIRYVVRSGKKPIFCTEKPNLFSDIYRDLKDIGFDHIKPFILNAADPKTKIKDENGTLLFDAPEALVQKRVTASPQEFLLSEDYDLCMLTYSQLSTGHQFDGLGALKELSPKGEFIQGICQGSVLILDESHNASGSSKRGAVMRRVVMAAGACVFLSATFAKRPDNMPVYALKTCISEANITSESMIAAMLKGGVALQEVISSQLVSHGQMIRRERSYQGIEVNYIYLEHLKASQRSTCDTITRILREIIHFQKRYIIPYVMGIDDMIAEEQSTASIGHQKESLGASSTPFFSKLFNVISQLLFSIKAEAVVQRALERLADDKKVVIAFSSTMESFIQENILTQEEEQEDSSKVRELVIDADFSTVLKKGLESLFSYQVKQGLKVLRVEHIDLHHLSDQAIKDYEQIIHRIENASTGITISPIDYIKDALEMGGYRVAEVTGRSYELKFKNAKDQRMKASVKRRKKVSTNDAFRLFNENEYDVLMINQSGSTGASAHAKPNHKVPQTEVKQRVMIMLQAELDINTEVQKRGRINRTGQILPPIYDYVISSVPAEERLMMMLQQKLKSLDANTSANQKQSKEVFEMVDFLNKYGDQVVVEYLMDNPKINQMIDDPLKLGEADFLKAPTSPEESEEGSGYENAAHKVSGRIATLSVADQEAFYKDVAQRYQNYIDMLRQQDLYDLEIDTLDFKAKTLETTIAIVGKGGSSDFGRDTHLEKCEVDILRKPLTSSQMLEEQKKYPQGKSVQQELLARFESQEVVRHEKEQQENMARRSETLEALNTMKRFEDLMAAGATDEALDWINKRKEGVHEKYDLSDALLNRKSIARIEFLKKYILAFEPGRAYEIPNDFTNRELGYSIGVLLRFKLNDKAPNPFAPGQFCLEFAVCNDKKYFTLPASQAVVLDAIIAQTHSKQTSELSIKEITERWQEHVTLYNKNRGIRYIVTGNILQAYENSKFRGRLINFTTDQKQEKKGLLLKETFGSDEETQGMHQYSNVSAGLCLRVVKALSDHAQLLATGGLAIGRHKSGNYYISTALSRQQSGHIYLDPALLRCVEDGLFVSSGQSMLAYVQTENLSAALTALGSLGVSFRLVDWQLEYADRPTLTPRFPPANPIPKPVQAHIPSNEPTKSPSLELAKAKLRLRLALVK